MDKVTKVEEIDFNKNFEIEGSWFVNVKGKTVQHVKHMHKIEFFDEMDDLKKFVKQLIYSYNRGGLKKGMGPGVWINYNIFGW